MACVHRAMAGNSRDSRLSLCGLARMVLFGLVLQQLVKVPDRRGCVELGPAVELGALAELEEPGRLVGAHPRSIAMPGISPDGLSAEVAQLMSAS